MYLCKRIDLGGFRGLQGLAKDRPVNSTSQKVHYPFYQIFKMLNEKRDVSRSSRETELQKQKLQGELRISPRHFEYGD